MRIFLDLCVTRRLQPLLVGCETVHGSRASWGGLVNGKLIARATEEGFDVLLTVDRNMSFQNSPAPGSLAIVVIQSRDTRFDALKPHVPAILTAILSARRGTFTPVLLDPTDG